MSLEKKKNEDTDGDEEQNGKQRSSLLSPLSSLLSSRPRSLLSTAVYMAGLFSLTGCESHETGGHQGPGPPRQHAPPQSAVHSVPQPSLTPSLSPSLHTNNLLHYFKYFIPQALSLSLLHNIFFHNVSSQFYQIFCLCLSFSLPNTPSFFLPSSGPLILSHLHVFAAWLSCPMFLPQPHIFSRKQKDEEGGGE